MKSDEEQPEVPAAQRLAQHSSRYLGIPVINRREHSENDYAHNHVMEVRDDKVGIAKLPIKRCSRKHNARQPSDEHLAHSGHSEQHRNLKDELSAPHRSQPVED